MSTDRSFIGYKQFYEETGGNLSDFANAISAGDALGSSPDGNIGAEDLIEYAMEQ